MHANEARSIALAKDDDKPTTELDQILGEIKEAALGKRLNLITYRRTPATHENLKSLGYAFYEQKSNKIRISWEPSGAPAKPIPEVEKKIDAAFAKQAPAQEAKEAPAGSASDERSETCLPTTAAAPTKSASKKKSTKPQ